MKMVAHDAVRENPHRDAVRCFCNDGEERPKIARFVKQGLAVVPAIENMLHKTVG
jgi:hypothetical protein